MDREIEEVSEAQIAVHWREEEYYQPLAAFIGQANASDPGIFERFSEKNFSRVRAAYHRSRNCALCTSMDARFLASMGLPVRLFGIDRIH